MYLSNQNIDAAIRCPISLQPFTKAQRLNCNHNLDLDSCISIYGIMIGKTCANPKPCPLCRRKVTKYKPNLGLQQLVDSICDAQKTVNYPFKKSFFSFDKEMIINDLDFKMVMLMFSNTSVGDDVRSVIISYSDKLYLSIYFEYDFDSFNRDRKLDELKQKLVVFLDENELESLSCNKELCNKECFAIESDDKRQYLKFLDLFSKFNDFDPQAKEKFEFFTNIVKNGLR